MSDNPPLAEIIGLEREEVDGMTVWFAKDGSPVFTDAWIPPDDLLDWLAERSTEVTITVANWMGPARVTVYPGRLTQATHVHGPTLADALAQAVRLVHDQTEA